MLCLWVQWGVMEYLWGAAKGSHWGHRVCGDCWTLDTWPLTPFYFPSKVKGLLYHTSLSDTPSQGQSHKLRSLCSDRPVTLGICDSNGKQISMSLPYVTRLRRQGLEAQLGAVRGLLPRTVSTLHLNPKSGLAGSCLLFQQARLLSYLVCIVLVHVLCPGHASQIISSCWMRKRTLRDRPTTGPVAGSPCVRYQERAGDQTQIAPC